MTNLDTPTLISTVPRPFGRWFAIRASSAKVWQLVAQTNVWAGLPLSLLSCAAQPLSLITDSRVAEPPTR